jgi:hypothetical protein
MRCRIALRNIARFRAEEEKMYNNWENYQNLDWSWGDYANPGKGLPMKTFLKWVFRISVLILAAIGVYALIIIMGIKGCIDGSM